MHRHIFFCFRHPLSASTVQHKWSLNQQLGSSCVAWNSRCAGALCAVTLARRSLRCSAETRRAQCCRCGLQAQTTSCPRLGRLVLLPHKALTQAGAQVPEMQRSELAGTVLQLKALGVDNMMAFNWLAPPPAETMVRALELLHALGALGADARLASLSCPPGRAASHAACATCHAGQTSWHQVTSIVSISCCCSCFGPEPPTRMLQCARASVGPAKLWRC